METPRVVGALIGDIQREAFARVKYGGLFHALAQEVDLLAVHDATLRGLARYLNLAQTFQSNRARWKERFYKNLPAFHLRSRQVRDFLKGWTGKADFCLQLGVMFDASGPIPSIIYTDYTAALSARREEAGRSPFSPDQRRKWLKLERGAFEHAHHICTRSALVRRSVIDDYGIAPEKVSTVGGGVNFAELPEVPDRSGRNTCTVLFIGKEFARKGGDLLLEAFAQIRHDRPNLCLKMVTGGPIPAGLPLEGVEVIAPTWDRTVIAQRYAEADLFVLPSRLETWGDVLLEAMAYGLPCVGVRGQSMEEIITEGVTGRLAEPEDAASLAAVMAEIIDAPAARMEAGQQARRVVEQKFTWAAVAKRLIQVMASPRCDLPGGK